MTEHELQQRVLEELKGGLWHTIRPNRFRTILESGAILPLTTNPDGWKTADGEPYRPFAQTLGAVSLFDFDEFDAERYREKYPWSSWDAFVPYREK